MILSRQDNLPNTGVRGPRLRHAGGRFQHQWVTGYRRAPVHRLSGQGVRDRRSRARHRLGAGATPARALGQQARERAVARFSEGVAAAQYRVVYEMLREWIVRNSLRAV